MGPRAASEQPVAHRGDRGPVLFEDHITQFLTALRFFHFLNGWYGSRQGDEESSDTLSGYDTDIPDEAES